MTDESLKRHETTIDDQEIIIQYRLRAGRIQFKSVKDVLGNDVDLDYNDQQKIKTEEIEEDYE